MIPYLSLYIDALYLALCLATTYHKWQSIIRQSEPIKLFWLLATNKFTCRSLHGCGVGGLNRQPYHRTFRGLILNMKRKTPQLHLALMADFRYGATSHLCGHMSGVDMNGQDRGTSSPVRTLNLTSWSRGSVNLFGQFRRTGQSVLKLANLKLKYTFNSTNRTLLIWKQANISRYK